MLLFFRNHPARWPGLDVVHWQAGSSLLEVLMAMAVLTVGLAGSAGLQASAMAANQQARRISLASLVASSVLDGLQLEAAEAGAYHLTLHGRSCALPGHHTGAALLRDGCTGMQQALGKDASLELRCTGRDCSARVLGAHSTPVLVVGGDL